MAFQLYSTGRVVDGVDEQQAVEALQRVMQLSEEKIRTQILNGQRRKLTSNDDREAIERLRDRLRGAGLAVELVDSSDAVLPPAPAETRDPPAARQGTRPGRRLRKPLLAVAGLALLLVCAGGYGWYWLHRPLTSDALAVEAALADGKLVAIGHADIARITFLHQNWFGAADPEALPVSTQQKQLVETLFSGTANFRDNLHHAFFAIHTTPEKQSVASVVLTGHFEEASLLAALKSGYEAESLGNGRWSLQKNPEKAAGFSCPEPVDGTSGAVAPRYYLHVTPQWLALSSSEAQLVSLAQRLATPATVAAQDLSDWHDYRSGQLASLMVFMPEEASKAVDGLPGMVVRKAANDTPQISNIAVRIGIEPLSAGLHADVRIASLDQQWNEEKGAALRRGLGEWTQGSNSVSASLGKLLSRISVESSAERLQVNVALDGEVLSEVGKSAQEAFAKLFTVQVREPEKRGDGPVADELMNSPTDYAANQGLVHLPVYETKALSTPPLWVDGSFAVDPQSITRNDEGLFELRLQGQVALPKAEGFTTRRSGRVTLQIDDIQDAAGTSLLRDERCIKLRGWSKRNHEAEVSEFLFGDHPNLVKTVRLNEGVVPEQVAAVRGRIEFAAPVQVKRLQVPLTVGSHVEHMGLRFYLNSVGADGWLSYQVSGAKERFLELRALNRDGKPLASDMSMESNEGLQVSRHFKGTIKSLEVYVAEKTAEHRGDFILRDLFTAPPGALNAAEMQSVVPVALSEQAWQRYAGLNLQKLHADPKDKEWHRGDSQLPRLATLVQAPVTFDLLHQEAQWGNAPRADLYYPMLPPLAGTLSALSYRLDEPAGKSSGVERYEMVRYPYVPSSGEFSVHHQIDGKPFARQQVSLQAGLEANERLQHLKGVLRFRLPLQIKASRLALNSLWQGQVIEGVEVALKSINRGIFPGYAIEIRGEIGRLVNLYGITATGERVGVSPVNFQEGGFWTMTLPFTPGMNEVELVVATAQKLYEYPFDLVPRYPVKAP